MNEIFNLPSSVLQHMQNSMTPARMEPTPPPMQASILVGSALTELARLQPELFGALVGAKLGVSEIVIETRELTPIPQEPVRNVLDFLLRLDNSRPKTRYSEKITVKRIRIR